MPSGRRPTRNAVIGHEYNIICSITWAIYGHYMFYLKHEWSLMTHEWPWTKISCSTFGLSFWLNPERDGCCVCLLLSAGEQAPRRKYAAPPSIPLGFHPDRKKNSENQLCAEKQSYMIVWFLLFSLISRCFNEIDEEPFSSDYSHSCYWWKYW